MQTRIALIAGSPAENSRSASLGSYACGLLVARGFATRTIHVRRLPAQEILHAAPGPLTVEALGIVAEASAVIVTTPVYKASYSGLLKAFLDVLPISGLRGKAVLPLASGASPGHLLALDYALRPVLAALGAYPVLPSVYPLDSQLTHGNGDGLALAPALDERLLDGVERLADALRRTPVPAPVATETLPT